MNTNTKNSPSKNVTPKNVTPKDLFELHPCQYCEEPCRGKQCKKCHLNMMKERSGSCVDCECIFSAKRPDGSTKKRCFDCQNSYTEKHIAPCPDCEKNYHKVLDDGRTFDKCFECYQGSFSTCEKCDNKTFKGLPLCSECYKAEKEKAKSYRKTSPGLTKDCNTIGCQEKTTYPLCYKCNQEFKNASSQYTTYTCEKCGMRGKGDYKFCEECERKKLVCDSVLDCF